MRICMPTTSYPRFDGDYPGLFIRDLAEALVADFDCHIDILAPGEKGAKRTENFGRLSVFRPSYFFPRRWQKLAYGNGILLNLRQSILPWINFPTFMGIFAYQIARLARSANLIHSHWSVSGMLAILTRPIHCCPVIAAIRGSDLSAKSPMLRQMTYWTVINADMVLCESRRDARCCRMWRRDNRVHEILNGVPDISEDEFKNHQEQRSVRKQVRFLSVGRLIPERQHMMLLEAFRTMAESFPNSLLDFVGDGDMSDHLKKRCKELKLQDRVTFHGMVAPSKIQAHLVASDVYVSPTNIEAFGNAVVEAAAAGLPIITTRVGFPSQLVHENAGGYVFNLQDQQRLEWAMRSLAESSEKR